MDKTSYYNKNKEMRKKYANEYYKKNKEKMKEYQKIYQAKYRQREGFKEWKKEYMKKYQVDYHKRNPPTPLQKKQRAESMKKYQEKNKERLNDYWKEYRQSDRGKQVMRINNWKQIGVKDADFTSLYNTYIKETHCWICGCEYSRPRQRHLDHDHKTGEVRYICCMTCNIKVLGRERGSK